jgi:hypothetical protein
VYVAAVIVELVVHGREAERERERRVQEVCVRDKLPLLISHIPKTKRHPHTPISSKCIISGYHHSHIAKRTTGTTAQESKSKVRR